MLQILKLNRLNKLMKEYHQLKAEAKRKMKAGDLGTYIQTLSKVEQVKRQYLATAKAQV